MKNNPLFFFFFILFFVACKNPQKDNPSTVKATPIYTEQDFAEGFQLMENNCFTCHSPNPLLENKVAPPMQAIKTHYITSETTQERFTADLISFLNNPTEEKSKIPDAVKLYNIMPKMNLTEAQISKIALYIYHSEFEKPTWYANHYEAERKRFSAATALSPIEAGQQLALKTKGVLGKNLLGAINSKGTEHALSFCATRAIPLTDSMSVALNAKIKRVSDKNRNPNNKANAEELAYIETAKLAIARNENPKPQLTTLGNKQIGYYPITTDNMCLKCHGKPQTEVLPKTLTKIKSLYPHDQALEYSTGDLRGIWVVEMDVK